MDGVVIPREDGPLEHVIDVRDSSAAGSRVVLPTTRRLFVPALALGIWITYSTWVSPIFATGFWGNLRWLLLAVLSVQGLLEIWRWGGETPMSAAAVGFVLFSVATFASTSYSVIPMLSLYKAVSFLLALVALVFGIGLRLRGNPQPWLHLLATTNLIVVTVAMLLLPVPSAYGGELLRGPFNNSNSLGTALALTLPALLWLRERHLRQRSSLLVSTLLTSAVLANIVVIFLSRSRSSLVAVGCVLVLYMFLRASRFVSIIVYGMLVLLLAAPAVASQVGRDAAYKGNDPQSSFEARIQQFDATLEAAKTRPISGFGFGISAGVTEWDGSLSVATIGREKTNAYIALVEEVGLIGAVPILLGLAGALVIGIRISRGTRRFGDGTPVALLALLVGGAVNVNFEAWLTSIGSFHAFIFWTTMGVLLMNADLLSPPPRIANAS